METIGERLKQKRLAADLTQEQLAQAIRDSDPMLNGFERITISQIENNTQGSMRDRLLLASCKVLGCSPEWLVYGEGEPDFETVEPEVEATEKPIKDKRTAAFLFRMVATQAGLMADSIEKGSFWYDDSECKEIIKLEISRLRVILDRLDK